MSISDWMAEVAAAYSWHRALGNVCVQGTYCRFVKDTDHPTVWSSNHISDVRASTHKDIATVMEQMESQFSHCSHRFVSTDCFTPPRFVAHLAMCDYRELAPTLQMILTGELNAVEAPALQLQRVEDEADWVRVYELVRADHVEGARTNRVAVSESVSRGIVESLRKKSGPCSLFMAILEGEPCAYGTAVQCPNGLGMVEDLYTLPAYRGRGIASAIIQHCINTLSRSGHEVIFLGAHVTERPKHLYRKLGFTPLMLTREWVLEI